MNRIKMHMMMWAAMFFVSAFLGNGGGEGRLVCLWCVMTGM